MVKRRFCLFKEHIIRKHTSFPPFDTKDYFQVLKHLKNVAKCHKKEYVVTLDGMGTKLTQKNREKSGILLSKLF